jgi:hypothetical protein
MNRSRVAPIVVLIVGAGVAVAGWQKDKLFPHTKPGGKATIEYVYEGLRVVANYDYSQRNHDTTWLLIDVALASKTRFVLHRDDFRLVTPEGQTVRLATQEQGRDDISAINSLIQNARIHRRNLTSFFSQQRGVEELFFYSFPFARSISSEGIVDDYHVTAGALLFQSPVGTWREGTYKLVLDNEHAKATLPINLQ